MRFVRRDRDAGYWGRELWLPRSHVNDRAIRNSLTFVMEDESRIEAWRDERHHIVVPRETFPTDRLAELEFPIYDTRGRGYEEVWFDDRFEARDQIQEDAWDALSATDHGVLNLACGRGKSGLALKKGAQLGGPILIVVSNTGTIEGWTREAWKFLRVPEHHVGIVKQKQFEWDNPVAIATVHTLAKKAQEWPRWFLDRWKLVIFDEAHHLPARTFSRTLPLFQGMRLGLTATVEREDGLESLYMFHVGRVLFSDLTQDLPAKIHFVQTRCEVGADDWEEINDVGGQFNIGLFRRWLGKQKARNSLILRHVDRARDEGRKVLVLSHSKDQVIALAEKVEGAGAIHGDIPHDRRLSILESHMTVFATPGCAEEAMNDPALDTLMFLTPFKVWRTFQQGVGRIQRPHPSKKPPLAILFEDVRIGPCVGLYKELKSTLRRKGHAWTTIPAKGRSRLERLHSMRAV